MFLKFNWDNLLFVNYSLIFLLLITGPALPDIFLNIFTILSLFIYRKKLIEIIKLKISFILGVLLLWFYILSFFAYDFKTSFIESVIFGRFILFIIFSYFIFSSISFRKIKILLYLIYVLCIFVSADTIYQFYNYSDNFGFGSDFLGREPEGLYGRLSGPFSDLVPGSYLSRLFFFILILFLIEIDKPHKKQQFFLSFSILLSLIFSVIFFSGERMALATTLLGLILSFLYNKKIRRLIFSLLIISTIFIIANLNYHPFYKDFKVINSSPNHEGLIIERKVNCGENILCNKEFKLQPSMIEILKNFKDSAYGQIYMSALHMWTNYKLTGIGLNNFEAVCTNEIKYKKFNQEFGCTTHPHNIYIQFLVETGFIGLIIFIFILFLLFKKIYESRIIEFKIFLFSALLTIFWPVMSTGSFLKNWNMVFISLIISLCLIVAKTSKIYKSEKKI